MKQIYLFMLMLLISFTSCKKEEIDSMTEAEQQAYADSVITANNTNTNNTNNNTGNTGNTNTIPVTECGVSWNEDLSYSTVTDVDGNTYSTIVIGTQEWMAENLAVTSFNDGIAITEGVNALEPYFPAYVAPNDTLVDCYGLLYNSTVITESSNVCPTNWHVPDSLEWTILFDYALPYDNGSNALGISRVLQSVEGWTFLGTDVLGYRMLPAGHKEPWDVDPTDVGSEAYLWTSTPGNSDDMYAITTGPISHDGKVLDLGDVHDHKSIRCIKD